MPDDSDPPRKFYQLKSAEFERLNQPPREAEPAEPTPAKPGAELDPSQRIDVRDLARQANENTPLLGVNSPANRDNEVHAMLRENLAHADAAGLNALKPVKKRSSRRKRDYWRVMLVVNAFFAFWAFGPYANPVTFVYGLGGMVFFTSGFTWVMFLIVEDY
jgi:hypothetical protein